jgi:hypothetical protein
MVDAARAFFLVQAGFGEEYSVAGADRGLIVRIRP